jgi:hypothetical protein
LFLKRSSNSRARRVSETSDNSGSIFVIFFIGCKRAYLMFLNHSYETGILNAVSKDVLIHGRI